MRTRAQDALARGAATQSYLNKNAKKLMTTATAVSWGLLGVALGYVLGSLWLHLDPHA